MDRKKGLIRTIRKVKVKDRPFKVEQLKCEHCGTKSEFKDTDLKLCPKCHSKVDKKTFKDVSFDEVQKIMSNEIVWECPECGKGYPEPTLCCNRKYMAEARELRLSDRQALRIEGEKPCQGYMCDGCKTLYVKQVECCQGSLLLQGTIYPEMDKKTLNKLNNMTVNAITGAIQ